MADVIRWSPPKTVIEHAAMQIVLCDSREMRVDIEKVHMDGSRYRYFVEVKLKNDPSIYDAGNFSQYDDALKRKVDIYEGKYLIHWDAK